MRNILLWVVACAALAACGGGGTSAPVTPAVPTPTPVAPTPTPTPPPPGPVLLTYSSTFGANVTTPTAAPPAIAFQAETQTATLTATQVSFAGPFTAASSCANVTVSPASSATGVFTVTAVTPAASGCTITVTGTATKTAPVSATVPAPGGVILGWVSNKDIATKTGPLAAQLTPINLIGATSLFGVVLVANETNYLGTFKAPVLSAGCGANLSAPGAAVQGPIAGPSQPAQLQTYYSVSAPAAAAPFTLAAGCTITVTDNAPTPNSGTTGVSLTTVNGGIQ